MAATTIAIMAATQYSIAAAQASQAAHDARVAQCTVTEATFNPGGATVEQKQHYAACVEFLYPQPSDEPISIASRASILAIVIVLVAATIIGAVRGWREKRDIIMSVCIGMIYAVFAALTIGAVALAVWGVKTALA